MVAGRLISNSYLGSFAGGRSCGQNCEAEMEVSRFGEAMLEPFHFALWR
jgi:hypothetical protein